MHFPIADRFFRVAKGWEVSARTETVYVLLRKQGVGLVPAEEQQRIPVERSGLLSHFFQKL
ncbi:hypothetical protein D3C81_1964980 [compost metagenome]